MRGAISPRATRVRKWREGTHADVERLEAVARRGAERDELGARVGDADLEVAIGVFLLEHDADRLFDVDEEAARRGHAPLVVRHAPRAVVPLLAEGGRAARVVAVRE